jgi:IclR family transcriptional regulator, acetate operon repressor
MATSQPPELAASDGGEPAAKGADRVLALFKALAKYPRGASLEELSAALGAPKSSTHRALATLRRAGLAEQTPTGGYRLGMEALRMAFSYYEALDSRLLVQPVLDRLADRFGETVHYVHLDGADVVYVAKVVQPEHGVYMNSRIGGRNPAHATGVGKLLLAYELADEEAVREFVAAHPLERRTEATIAGAGELHAELERIRAQGYAVDHEENERGVGCVAVPVYIGPGPSPTGAVSVTALLHRTDLETLVAGVDDIRMILRESLPSSELPLSR